MARQHARPHFVPADEGPALALERVDLTDAVGQGLSEAWLQRILFQHPSILPIEEIEPAFAPALPLCRELPTNAGPLDIAYVSPSGLLTLVECKLWRNPGARREVVAQILDYAKEICTWSYADLVAAVGRALHRSNDAVFEAADGAGDDLQEHEFIDAVARNLRRGRFLLLVVGDGIRESTEQIAEYLQAHAHLNFAFALVEAAIHRAPDSVGSGWLVQPRVICKTVEIERAVVRVVDGKAVVERSEPRRPESISLQVFLEQLPPDYATRQHLSEFLSSAEARGLQAEVAQNINLKSIDGRYNFATLSPNGHVVNRGIAGRTLEEGFPEIGEQYLEAFAALLVDAEVSRPENRFYWTVRHRGGTPVTLAECMAVRHRWLEVIGRCLEAIERAREHRREIEGGR